jgi:hypothetical protein
MGDIPQALLPQFNIWLSENHSFMTSREPLEDGAFGGDYDQFVRTVGFPKFFASLLICMQSSMRLTWTQKGDLGWVHPMAQKGDKIVRIFGCRQYVVLRAFETGEDYHVIGDVHLFGMSVDDLGDFGDDQVQSLKIH